jgi:putative ABC transport system permease protein
VTLILLFVQTVLTALRQIWANKIRAMLTTLGIIIGVAAVVTIVAAVGGLRSSILKEFETFGARKVYIDGFLPRHKRGRIPWWKTELNMREVNHVVKNARTCDKFTPLYFSSFDVEHGDIKETLVLTTGIWPEWHEIEARSVTSGRPFNSIDEEQRLAVCLVNDKLIELLKLNKEPAGTPIRLNGRRFNIVGVVETKDVGAMFGGGGETAAEIYIPLSVAMSFNPERKHVNFLLGQLVSPDAAEEAKAEIGFMLRRLRGLEPGEDDNFQVNVLQSFIDQFNRLAFTITVGAAVIVGISLLVGGIGIMNIMLVSVSERTREIGLRKALGARPEVVLLQFLVEAVTLCLCGGALGLGLGQLLVLGMNMTSIEALKMASIPMWAVILAVGFSAFIGIVFGMFPAIKAARLNPIDALRHD